MRYDLAGYRKLASAVLEDCVRSLGADPPSPRRPPEGMDRIVWVRRWERWEAGRLRELRFLGNPISATWCELAGVDRDAMVSQLDKRGLMYDAADRFPVDACGRSLLYA